METGIIQIMNRYKTLCDVADGVSGPLNHTIHENMMHFKMLIEIHGVVNGFTVGDMIERKLETYEF